VLTRALREYGRLPVTIAKAFAQTARFRTRLAMLFVHLPLEAPSESAFWVPTKIPRLRSNLHSRS
jgi:hypothetical protein